MTEHGYVLVKAPYHPDCDVRGYVYEHRLVAAKMLGRLLAPGERVKHHDGDRGNNHPSNLRIVAPLNRSEMTTCACGCGAEFTRIGSGLRPRRYVSGHNGRRSAATNARPRHELGVGLPEDQRAELTEAFGGLCAYGCGRRATCWDHVIPWSAGGSFRSPGNTVPACRQCNSHKSASMPWPWIDAAMQTKQAPAWIDVLSDALTLGALEIPEEEMAA